MTPKAVLLKSSAVSKHFRNGNALTSQLSACEELCLPGPALAELYYGAFRSDRPPRHLEDTEKFLGAAQVLSPDQDTARHYGMIAAPLARKGTPIPQNDIWMAALSIQCDLPLATADRHSEHVEGWTALFW